MTPITEGQLEFTFTNARSVIKFDDPSTHGVAEMKAVDFVVEFEDFVLFVEVKDPDHTESTPERVEAFRAKLHSGKLLNDLKYKFRDTFIYRWACDELDKPIKYVVLIQMGALQPRTYQLWTDKLRRALPTTEPANWVRRLLSEAWVMNMHTWNTRSPFGSVRRI